MIGLRISHTCSDCFVKSHKVNCWVLKIFKLLSGLFFLKPFGSTFGQVVSGTKVHLSPHFTLYTLSPRLKNLCSTRISIEYFHFATKIPTFFSSRFSTFLSNAPKEIVSSYSRAIPKMFTLIKPHTIVSTIAGVEPVQRKRPRHARPFSHEP